jgi:hypothetical protein
MDGPPILKLSGPPKTDRHVTVAELSSRLNRAITHPYITNNQRDKLKYELRDVDSVPNKEALWFIPEILITVEAIPRPANGGARKRLHKRLRKTLRKRLRKTLRALRKRTHRK